MGICSIEGCEKPTHARGWCGTHVKRFYANGDPMVTKTKVAKGFVEHGYRLFYSQEKQKKREHVMVAEKALGKPLPANAVVHHVDENRLNNIPTNLVICPDRAYHNMIHARMRAYEATGHYDWRKCCRCLEYDDPVNLSFSGPQAYHAACNAAHVRKILGRSK